MHTAAAKGNRAAEIDAESKRREPIFSPASAMQTAAKLKNRAEGERGTQIPSPAAAMPTAAEGNRAAESDEQRDSYSFTSISNANSAAGGHKAAEIYG